MYCVFYTVETGADAKYDWLTLGSIVPVGGKELGAFEPAVYGKTVITVVNVVNPIEEDEILIVDGLTTMVVVNTFEALVEAEVLEVPILPEVVVWGATLEGMTVVV